MLIVGFSSKRPTIRGDIYSTTTCKTNKTCKSTDYEMSEEHLTFLNGSTDQYSPGLLYNRPITPFPGSYVNRRGKSKYKHLPLNTVCPRSNALFGVYDVNSHYKWGVSY